MFRQLLEYIVNDKRPYIKGHITNGASTFTFTVNENESVTVNVNSDGYWKWYIDRTITSLKSAFNNLTNWDYLKFYKLNLNFPLDSCLNGGSNNFLHTVDLSNSYFNSSSYKYFSAGTKCLIYIPSVNTNLYLFLSSQSNIIATGPIYSDISVDSTNGISKEGILSLINNTSKASMKITISSSIYDKCKQNGEWYNDVKAAIDAKALEGYNITLVV